mgnify:CR=1 FL=1
MITTIENINTDTKKIILSIANSIKRADPEKIILFGSYAKNNNTTTDSDLDILVVTNSDYFPKNYSEKMDVFLPIAKLIRDYRKNIPIDLLVYTKPMFDRFLNYDSLMAREIKDNGIILYEKNN